MTKRYYIHFRDSGIQFPNNCPVCGEPATETGLIAASIERYAGRNYYAEFQEMPKISQLALVQLHVPVCAKHYFSFKDRSRATSFLWVLNGLIMVALLLIAFFESFFIISGVFWETPIAVYTLVLFAFFVLVNLALRPTSLEKAIRIEQADKMSGEVIISVEHRWYRDQLIELNPMKATAVVPKNIPRRMTT